MRWNSPASKKVRFLVNASDSGLTTAAFAQNQAPNAGGLCHLGIKGHQPSVRVRPKVDDKIAAKCSIVMLNIKTKMTKTDEAKAKKALEGDHQTRFWTKIRKLSGRPA